MKLGRKPVDQEKLNKVLKFSSILHKPALPTVPQEFDYDRINGPIPTPMFGNDIHGDCVLAGRANHTLRFERTEQGFVIPIKDKDVIDEWHAENGNTEDGLNVLESLKLWRTKGWEATGEHYDIDAYSSIDPCMTAHVQAAIYFFGSAGFGLDLPVSVTSDMDNTTPWDVHNDSSDDIDPDSGHYVIASGFNQKYVKFITWGREQLASWAFVEFFTAECYGIVDQVDRFVVGPPVINVPELRNYLQQLAA